jgi:hypothetical protein
VAVCIEYFLETLLRFGKAAGFSDGRINIKPTLS